MRLIKPSFEIWEQGPSQKDILKHVERCGRICYASLDKITDDSYQKFVDKIRKNGHLSVMEHGTVYMTYFGLYENDMRDLLNKYKNNPYSKVDWYIDKDNNISLYMTTNLRVLLENGWKGENICAPTEHHHRRVTVHIICDRAIANEIVRHRKFSYSQQSTRYCNYTKNKFGNELTFVIPNIYQKDLIEGEYKPYGYAYIVTGQDDDGTVYATYQDDISEDYFKWLDAMWHTQIQYDSMIQHETKPEYARNVLPLSLATELVMTGFIEDWEHFFELRTSPRAHPQMKEIAIPLKKEFIKREYIKDDGREAEAVKGGIGELNDSGCKTV